MYRLFVIALIGTAIAAAAARAHPMSATLYATAQARVWVDPAQTADTPSIRVCKAITNDPVLAEPLSVNCRSGLVCLARGVG